MSKNKVFYGEYSLKHWINLILQKDIVVPEYQRYFVWSEQQVKQFLNAIQEEQFIPPITIGFHNGKNLIIDGQQRLTSLFLSYLSIFPDRDKFKKDTEKLYSQSEDEQEQGYIENVIEWKLESLTKLGQTKEHIKDKIGHYYKSLELPLELSDEFLNNHFLGFSYIVPNTSDEQYINKYFSSLFKNINTQGSRLSILESRQSLYYIKSDLQNLFKPNFINDFRVNGDVIDFVRVLSFLFQYKKDGNENNLAKGYIKGKKRLENYYEDYIFDVINDNDAMFGKFSNFFQDEMYIHYLNNVRDALYRLNIPNKLPSIVDADIYLFGLVYFIFIEKKELDDSKFDNLRNNLNKRISSIKLDENKKKGKNPNQLSNIKERIRDSIEVYRKGLKNE